MFAASAVLAALVGRTRTGEGQRIDISLLDSQVALLAYVASNFLVSGETPRRYGNGHPNIVPYQTFRASDGYFAFAAGNDGQWRTFCRAVDRPWLAEEARFATNTDRVQHRDELVSLLSELFASRPAGEWMELCHSIGIPSAPINTLEQVFQDPQVQARGLAASAVHPLTGEVPQVASPLRIPTSPVGIRRAPPHLGEHTDEILTQRLGCSAAQIAGWRQAGVV
jgi:crotonobetainyl-CoA:carnitine CoA-transferase CaiB-like acyl-CoA transferase